MANLPSKYKKFFDKSAFPQIKQMSNSSLSVSIPIVLFLNSLYHPLPFFLSNGQRTNHLSIYGVSQLMIVCLCTSIVSMLNWPFCGFSIAIIGLPVVSRLLFAYKHKQYCRSLDSPFSNFITHYYLQATSFTKLVIIFCLNRYSIHIHHSCYSAYRFIGRVF